MTIKHKLQQLVHESSINTTTDAKWNLSEKSVKIYLEDEQWNKAKELNFDVKWGFIFVEK